ncbi:beta-L-arabinofuranosidase domain-containing protein [Microbacterium sp. NPDC056044]|uniref:beta-L-arabinofuranosidase domain-containing protein n=1 Tax=Microbacterium sp. NPDC056044 TaxID=3345690 RepID=UPI0035E22658
MPRTAEPQFAAAADVRLAGADLEAQRTVSATLRRIDPERLLAPFRREAGLPARAENYGGWESDGLDGHTAGHVLSAASTLAASGDADAAALVRTLVRSIRECQLATGSGYVGGVPDGEALWDELRAGRVEAGAFHLNGRWVPLYNLHKILAGLVDAVELMGDATAREALEQLGAWWLRVTGALDDEAFERVLECEFGGMTEAFARLALVLQDAAYLRLARRFARRGLVEPLAAGRDELDGLHANTQIPVAVGFATIERAARTLAPELLPDIEAREGAAARVFFDRVARHRSAAIGGDSVREHFPQDFASMFIAREGPETCNTHNMVKLAAELHQLTGDDAYLLWAERARANHLRSAQHPGHGGLVYFTPQRPAHYRVYSPEAEGFWCCMGSGFEAQARHGALVYAVDGDEVRVNALVPSRAALGGVEVTVDADTTDPSCLRATIEVRAARPVRLAVLVPDWVDGDAAVVIEGAAETDAATAAAGTRAMIALGAGSSVVTVTLPRRLRFERPADGSAWAWIVDGPEVLAERLPDDDDDVAYRGTGARMGHIAVGPLRALAETPVLAPDALAHAVRLGAGRVRVPTADGGAVELEAFAGIHDARYTLSWPVADDAGADSVAGRRAELERIDAASLGLEARTRDVVAFGEQQPESDHGLTASDEEVGVRTDARWRRTRGAITVILRDWSGTAETLRVSWLGGDEDAHLRLTVGESVVFDEAVPAGSGDATREVPLGAATGAVELAVRLEAAGAATPRLREVRLLAAASDR